MTHPTPHWHSSPEDFLASWSSTRGNLRRFFEDRALPPVDATTQKAAGEAAAAAAIAEVYGINLKDFETGLTTVTGSYEAAGGVYTTTPNPEVTPPVRSAAFFDVDNTLIQGSSLIVFAVGLARRRYLSVRDIVPVVWKQMKFRVTGNENSDDMAEGRQAALEFIRGRSVAELTALCEEIVDSNMSDKLWPGTKQIAQQHLAQGEQVWLVSATPVQLAQILAQRLGLTGAIGTVAEVKDGVFTGRLVGDILHGPGKKHAVAALAALERLDLGQCTAYSDSINDTPMLSMVGTAVAINPDRKLRAVANRKGWAIYDYRSVRRAVRTFGAPALATAFFSLRWWRGRGRRR